MNERIKNIFRVLRKPKYAVPIVILIIVLIFVLRSVGGNKPAYQTEIVTRGNVFQEVDATGTVKPVQNVDLGFELSGKVADLAVKVGDSVVVGDVLANLQNDEQKANLRSAQAKLSELLRGATTEDLAVSESSVQNAESDLTNAGVSLADKINDTFVKADDAVRNHIDKLYTNPNTSPSFGVTITSGLTTYSLSESNETIRAHLGSERKTVGIILGTWTPISNSPDILDKANKALGDLEVVQTLLTDVAASINKLVTSDATGNDIYAAYKADVSTARTNVSTALVTLRAADQVYVSAGSSLDIAKKQLTLKQAPATSEGVAIQQAAVDVANAAYLKTVIKAPFDGLITKIVPEKGEIVSPASPVVSMISAENLEVEVNIPEADIPKVKIGNEADITFDAYGKDFVATSTVVSIDPAATVVEGVPTYRCVLSFSMLDARIKPGMTANIAIHGEQRDNVVAVPQRAVITKDSGKIIEAVRAGKIVELPVTTGLRGSDGNIEITTGLSEGEVFIPSPLAQ